MTTRDTNSGGCSASVSNIPLTAGVSGVKLEWITTSDRLSRNESSMFCIFCQYMR